MVVIVIIVIVKFNKGTLLGHAVFLTEILTTVIVNLQNLHTSRDRTLAQNLIKGLAFATPRSVEK